MSRRRAGDQQEGRKKEGRRSFFEERHFTGLFLHFIVTLFMRFSLQESDKEDEGGTCAECQLLQLKMNCYREALDHANSLVIQYKQAVTL